MQIFKPVDGAKSLEILTQPTHGRRIGSGKIDTDYKLKKLPISLMKEFHKDYFLYGELRTTFGVFSPGVIETGRKILSIMGIPLKDMLYLFRFNDAFVPRDENGVFYIEHAVKKLNK